MEKAKNNIIEDWLEQYNDPQIEQEVKSKLRNQILEYFEERLEKLKNTEKEVRQEIEKLRVGNMVEEALENIGSWYQDGSYYFKILGASDGEVKILFSRSYQGEPTFEIETLHISDWKQARLLEEPTEQLQERINKLNGYLN